MLVPLGFLRKKPHLFKKSSPTAVPCAPRCTRWWTMGTLHIATPIHSMPRSPCFEQPSK